MPRYRWLLFVAVLAAGLCAVEAKGQMFGARSLGGGLGTRTQASDIGGVGTLNFNERFIRGNRRAGAFVGGDSRDRRNFVGSQQLHTGRVRPTITRPRPAMAPDANRTAPHSGVSRTGVYEPRLSVAFDVTPPPAEAVAEDLARLLHAAPSLHATRPIEVLVEGRVATLRGEVASEHDRLLAERLILFEPGIDSVRNELKVKR